MTIVGGSEDGVRLARNRVFAVDVNIEQDLGRHHRDSKIVDPLGRCINGASTSSLLFQKLMEYPNNATGVSTVRCVLTSVMVTTQRVRT